MYLSYSKIPQILSKLILGKDMNCMIAKNTDSFRVYRGDIDGQKN